MKVVSVLVLSGVLCAGGIAAGVQLKGAATSVTGEYTAALEEPHARIINEFSELAGSEANARSLVAGLRQGSEITLTVPAKGGQPGMATRFTPPTRPLDYGDVRISLALARGQLAQLGIDRPTPTQIKAVLAGGGVATRVSGQATTPFLLPGVLQLRAGGIGWARIAGTIGVTLGPAMNGNAHPAAVTPPPISSAGFTTTAAASARNAPLARQPALARRSDRGGPEPEIRRSGASIVAAAEGVAKAGNVTMPVRGGASSTVAVPGAAAENVAKAGNVTMPVRDGANSTVVVPAAAVEAPRAADELIRHEEGQTAD